MCVWCPEDSGASASPLLGETGPGVSPGPLVGGTVSWGIWLQGPECPQFAVCPLLGGVRVQVVLRLVMAYWWVEPGPRISGCKALGSWSWCQPTGGWGGVPELLEIQGVQRQLAC